MCRILRDFQPAPILGHSDGIWARVPSTRKSWMGAAPAAVARCSLAVLLLIPLDSESPQTRGQEECQL